MGDSGCEEESRILRGIQERGIDMKGIKNRLVAAAITIAFMAIVHPDPEPSLWGVALVSILMYEGIRICIEYVVRENTRCKKREAVLQNIQYREEDGARWANEWMDPYPFREVS